MVQARFRKGVRGASQRRGLNDVVSPRYLECTRCGKEDNIPDSAGPRIAI
jgi:hypothetical protein